MRKISQEELDSRLQALTTTNLPVYKPSQYGTRPECLYFYYMTLTPLEKPEVRVYYYDHRDPMSSTELASVITDLTTNARNNDSVPPSCSGAFEAIHWRRKSYLVLVVDDNDKRLKQGAAIMFTATTPNYTFLDGRDLRIYVPNSSGDADTLWALLCINHMKKADGSDLGPNEFQHFSYDIILQSARTQELFEQVIDPGGTNEGPPVGPP